RVLPTAVRGDRPRLWPAYPVRHRPGRPAWPELHRETRPLRRAHQPTCRLPPEAWNAYALAALRPRGEPPAWLPALRNRTRPEPARGSPAAGTHRGREAELPESEPVAADEPVGEQRRPEGHPAEAVRSQRTLRH